MTGRCSVKNCPETKELHPFVVQGNLEGMGETAFTLQLCPAHFTVASEGGSLDIFHRFDFAPDPQAVK